MKFDKELDTALWNGERSICFFIHEKRTYWVIDYKYNFTIDAEADYRSYLEKGYISDEQFTKSCESFREGILILSTSNFKQYLNTESAWVVSKDELEGYIGAATTNLAEQERICKVVEEFLVFGSKLSNKDFKLGNQIASKLPLFYINFDRRIYMHMDSDRSHETLVPKHWTARVGEFSWFIPLDLMFWRVDSKVDLWKLKYI